MAIKYCDICGAELTAFAKHKTANGRICRSCFTAAGFNVGMVCFADTSEQIKNVIDGRKAAGETRSMREQHMETKEKIDTAEVADLTPRCSKCGSTSITANKKGFGAGKAAAGVLLTGGLIGLAAGGVGAKKVRITCLNCGHQWDAGKS